MNSSVIGKIEKARRYAGERRRIQFKNLDVQFEGENGTHQVSLNAEKWHCTCDFFTGYGACAHTMAMERVLEGMLPAAAATSLQHA